MSTRWPNCSTCSHFLRPRADILAGDDFYIGYDLRPSSPAMCQAVVQAIRDSGMQPVNLGRVPTPALTYYALTRGKGSIMVTGSHIPFDRNGYKLNTSQGELLKTHEEPINQAVAAVRERIYGQPFSDSPFNERGSFKTNAHQLPPENQGASSFYLTRYTGFFRNASLCAAGGSSCISTRRSVAICSWNC